MTPTEAATLARYIGAHFPQQPIDEFTGDASENSSRPTRSPTHAKPS